MTDSKPTGLQWHRTSPVAVVFFLFRTVRQIALNAVPAMVVIGAAYASGGPGRKAMMTTGAGLLLALGAVGSILSWMRFRFCVTGDHVLVKSGVLHREDLSVEFNRIQNVNLREPFYMRPFGLVVLGIDTAGSSKKEILLGGIEKDLALQLRKKILAVERPNPQEIPTESDHKREPSILLSRSIKDITIYGLTVNFMLWFAIALGAVLGAGDSNEEIITWLASRSQLVEWFLTIQDTASLLDRLLWATGLVIALVLLLPLISILGAVFRHYGYQLKASGETYRREGGLLTRHEESLKRHKIQAAVLKQNFVARVFKRTNLLLRVASAGTGVESGQIPTGGKSSFMVPALHPPEVSALTHEFLPGCNVDQARFSRIDRRRLMTVVLAFAGIIALPITIVLSLLISWKFIAIIPVVLAIASLVSNRYWLKSGYAVVGAYGFMRRGFLGTVITAFPLFKVQRIDISQSRGQRRRGLAHLHVHLASHSLTAHFIPMEDAEKIRDLALYEAESSGQAWY